MKRTFPEWAPTLAANQRACPTVGARLTHCNDVLQAAWAMEPQTQAEQDELEQLEREVLLAAGATRCAGVGDGSLPQQGGS